jgi:lysophospholipase L1-like esterase
MKYIFISCLIGLLVFAGCSKNDKITIYTIGDSTMAIKKENKRPETGWGEGLPLMFDSLVTIENHAVNGRSSRSFISEGRWAKVFENLKRGDIVLIQFGHNDSKVNDSTRYTNPSTQYRANLVRFINDSRSRGAFPVLLTSIMRRNFNEKGVLVDTHGSYPEVMRSVALEMETPLIDAQLISEQMMVSLGSDKSKSMFLHLEAGENPNYPNGVADDTHLNQTGAFDICKAIVEELVIVDPRLQKHLKKD